MIPYIFFKFPLPKWFGGQLREFLYLLIQILTYPTNERALVCIWWVVAGSRSIPDSHLTFVIFWSKLIWSGCQTCVFEILIDFCSLGKLDLNIYWGCHANMTFINSSVPFGSRHFWPNPVEILSIHIIHNLPCEFI